MTDHYQQPPPFPLEDELVAPDGRTIRGTRARVASLLLETARLNYRHTIGRHQGPPGKVPRHLLVEPWSGGAEGARRVRDLPDYGWAYRFERFEPPGDEESFTMVYWLEGRRTTDKPPPKREPEHPKPAPRAEESHPLQGKVCAVVRSELLFDSDGWEVVTLGTSESPRLLNVGHAASADEYRKKLSAGRQAGMLERIVRRYEKPAFVFNAPPPWDPCEELAAVLRFMGAEVKIL